MFITVASLHSIDFVIGIDDEFRFRKAHLEQAWLWESPLFQSRARRPLAPLPKLKKSGRGKPGPGPSHLHEKPVPGDNIAVISQAWAFQLHPDPEGSTVETICALLKKAAPRRQISSVGHDLNLMGNVGDMRSYNEMLADSAWLADWKSYFACICACRRAGAWEHALDLLNDAWSKELEPNVECYSHVISACGAEAKDQSSQLLQELRNWGPAPTAKRFHTTPMLKWIREMKQYGCGVRNEIDWQGDGAIPSCGAGSWLLPSQDTVALRLAERQAELRHAGWRVVRVAPEVVETLRDKAEMIRYAVAKGIGEFTPKSYLSALEAEYPCILKPKLGTFGKDTHVVRSMEEVERFTKSESLASKWVLQELVPGRLEYSTTLLVLEGEVVDYVNTLYEYDGEEYVWPFVDEVRHEYVSVPEAHLDVMRVLLSEFSGICCLGYKLRRDGTICIFEVNPRIGGDLVFECPKKRARSLFEKLNFMF
eukprot:s845_g4.t1